MNLLKNGKLLPLSALAVLIAGTSLPVPALADTTPAYDITGVWKNQGGEQFQIIQEDKRVTVIAVNQYFAHIADGFYTGPNTVQLYIRRQTRPGGCVTVLKSDFTITSANSMVEKAAATETTTAACQVPTNYSAVQTNTRVY
jgi:hypothetical protein